MHLPFGIETDQVFDWATQYWLVPVGMVALYFYGVFHFNTPDYDVLDTKDGGPVPLAGLHLVRMAPPRYTTTRRRFRRYALRYVFVLEAAFLLAVFGWPVLQIAATLKTPERTVPPIGDLQSRAIWALFTLTGLLSSFPYVKDVDTWILRHLHEAASVSRSGLLRRTVYRPGAGWP